MVKNQSPPHPSDLQRRRKSLVKIHRSSELTTEAFGGSLDQCRDGDTVALDTVQNDKAEFRVVSLVLTYLSDFAAELLRVLNFSFLPTFEDVPAADK